MIWLECIEPEGFEEWLEYGQLYQVRRLPCGAVEVVTGRGVTFTCAASRFGKADHP